MDIYLSHGIFVTLRINPADSNFKWEYFLLSKPVPAGRNNAESSSLLVLVHAGHSWPGNKKKKKHQLYSKSIHFNIIFFLKAISGLTF